jgi:lipopolysaccharide transport system ATP-binding protein
MNAYISLKDVNVSIPIYDAESFSLRTRLLKRSTKIKENHILKNISFEIAGGERVGVYGHNGAGKTSLLRLISGGYYPQNGSVLIEGNMSNMIDISLGLDHDASGYENIKLKLGLVNAALRNDRDLISSIVNFSDLEEVINDPIRTYSSGMVMRLAFSIATGIHSDILVLDEWLSVGDASFAEKSEARMMGIVEKSSILVIASHNMDLLNKICTRIIVMDHGNITSDEVKQ